MRHSPSMTQFPMASRALFNTGASDGLLPEGTEPFTYSYLNDLDRQVLFEFHTFEIIVTTLNWQFNIANGNYVGHGIFMDILPVLSAIIIRT